MLRLQPLLAFAEAARRGNFAEASRELGCTPSSLAKAVARLERQLGVRLFHRTTRRVTLTDDGRRLFERCQRVLTELEQLHDEATGARTAVVGTLRIDMPVALGRIVMLPLLARLSAEHPRLVIDARFSDRYVDLVRDGIDVAIRTGMLDDSSLVARPFGKQELLLFAAPAYLERAGTPESLTSLSEHTAVVFRVPSSGKQRKWQLRSGNRDVEMLPPSRICVDDGDALVHAAVLGMGIGQVPHYMVAEPIARGDLIELLPKCRPRPMPIAAVMPSARMVPARVRVLLDLIAHSVDVIPPAPVSASVLRSRVKPARRPRSRR